MSDPLAAERALIDQLLRVRPPRRHVSVDAGDDAAILADGTVVTVDAMVEGVHFTDATPAYDLGHKLLAVSVSDIAAMGARPTAAVLAIAVARPNRAWAEAFAAGLAEACQRYGVDLVGGDTTGSPGPTTLSLTLLGRCVRAPWLRSTARPGDILLVTGTLGDAGAGWMLPDPWPEARRALDHPEPPLDFAVAAAATASVAAAMDLSDGLAADLRRLCAASGCGAWVDPARLPASPQVAAHPRRLSLQTCGGEDYQLLLAARPEHVDPLAECARASGVRLTPIGAIDGGDGPRLLGAAWPEETFDHFQRGGE